MSKPSVEYVYGINPCFEIIRGGRRKIYRAFIAVNSDRNPRIKKLTEYLNSKQVPIELVDKGRLFELSKSTEHQGAVIKCSPYPYAPFSEMLNQKKILMLDNVEDPHNVGAILRSAEIFGFHSVVIPSRGVPEIYPSIVKVSAGACEHINIAREDSANGYFKKAFDAGFEIVALDEEGKFDLEDLRNQSIEKIMLVIGGEGKSVGQYIINNAQYVASIRQQGKINSLNASVAAGIAMFVLGGI